MHPFFKSVFRTISMLGFAAVIGVVAATFTTCGIGLAHDTGTWCALPFVWFIGFPVAITTAIIFGLPLTLIFRKLRLTKWWQFGLTGFVCAMPIWSELAEPFSSARWVQSGFYDSLNYLGSGCAGGLAYWWITRKFGMRGATSRGRGESDGPA